MATAFLAPALVQLRNEINSRWPNRDKTSDGWIGDAAHSARVSDHNPDANGQVHAIDVDVDGIDLAACLREVIGDPRVEYVISNRRIWTRQSGWVARVYTGTNPHDHHFHTSLRYGARYEKNTTKWFMGTTTRPAKPFPLKAGEFLGIKGTKNVAAVKLVQVAMNRLGNHLVVDGDFGPATERIVKVFQAHRGLVADGMVGPKTWARMGITA
jgi:Putative peptidoglycan binding domain